MTISGCTTYILNACKRYQNFIVLLAHRAFASIHRFTCLSCPHASVSCHVNRKILNIKEHVASFGYWANSDHRHTCFCPKQFACSYRSQPPSCFYVPSNALKNVWYFYLLPLKYPMFEGSAFFRPNL